MYIYILLYLVLTLVICSVNVSDIYVSLKCKYCKR